MKRDELIEVIDQLCDDSLGVGERADLLRLIRFESEVGHWAPVSVWGTLKRSCIYGFICLRKIGSVHETEKRRFRYAERMLGAVLVSVVVNIFFVLFFGALIYPLLKIAKYYGIGPGGIILFSALLGGLFFYLFLRQILKVDTKEPEIHRRFEIWCFGCGYELRGLESALGDELWVGPARCPECGQEYPAIRE